MTNDTSEKLMLIFAKEFAKEAIEEDDLSKMAIAGRMLVFIVSAAKCIDGDGLAEDFVWCESEEHQKQYFKDLKTMIKILADETKTYLDIRFNGEAGEEVIHAS